MNKILDWLKENTLAASLIAVLVVGTLSLGSLFYFSWSEYSTASADYESKSAQLQKLSQQKPFPSESNLRGLESIFSTEQSSLQSLVTKLKKFDVPSFGNISDAKPQDQPQRFQDALRNEVTRIKQLAASTGAILPPAFYLGLEEYENRPPSQEDVPTLSKQLTVLDWTAEMLAKNKDLILSEFSNSGAEKNLKKETSKKPIVPAKDSPPYAVTSGLKIGFRCNQGALREIVNTLSASPYFLVIDQLLIQNTSTEPPKRDTPQSSAPPTTDGSEVVQRLPIVVGRELLNVSMRIRGLEFLPSNTNAFGIISTPATK
jgi:hypothetical protein